MNVLFFGPIMPIGVVITLLAKVIEIQFDLVKMLHVRRMQITERNLGIARSVSWFMVSAIVSSVGWHLALALITYNDDLYMWDEWRYVLVAVAFVWIFGGLFAGIMVASRLPDKAVDLPPPPAKESAAESIGDR